MTWILVCLQIMMLMVQVRPESTVECDAGEEQQLALNYLKEPSKIIDTIKNITNKWDCYRECCALISGPKGDCNAVSFEQDGGGFVCKLLHCEPFETCYFERVPSSVSAKIKRPEMTTHNTTLTSNNATTIAPSANNTTPTVNVTTATLNTTASPVNGSSFNVSSNATTLNATSSSMVNNTTATDNTTTTIATTKTNVTTTSQPPSKAISTQKSPSTSSKSGPTTQKYASTSMNQKVLSELQKEQAEWNALWNAVAKEGEKSTTKSYFPWSSPPPSSNRPSTANHDSASATHKSFDSAYLGSFSDTSVDGPALIIGATATVLFAVIVLICIVMKLNNRQRSKYKRLREDESFNSNSVHSPLTGGYEPYD